ncbi:MAG: hypothetical protein AAB425_02975 [Bdellovibrionota bacterium]
MMDPSKMDPATIAELTALMRELPMDQIQKMQSLMHNAMAGFPVQKEMAEFEQNLPPGFREKLLMIMLKQQSQNTQDTSATISDETAALPQDAREARLVVLRAVAAGQLSPEDAEPLLQS